MDNYRECVKSPAYEQLDRGLHLHCGGGKPKLRRQLKKSKRRAERRFSKLMLSMGFQPDFETQPRGWAS